ncbi:TLR4 regulator and MIR-interacting MSAP [Homalodisca vitripennis]|nr:TLR4 regulator and MIR-interacting MSAP [Homalodisca vitripennis]
MIMSNSLTKYIYLIIVLVHSPRSLLAGLDRKYVKCLVCQRIVEEMYREVEGTSPSLRYQNKGYILEDNKNMKESYIEMRRSDVFLDDVMDRLCEKMNDYARGIHIDTGELEVLPLVIGKNMNPVLQEYKLVQDGDLESLEYYCQSVLSEYADDMINLFKAGGKDVSDMCFGTELCSGYERKYNPIRFDEL